MSECCRHVELSAALGKAAQDVNIVAQPPIFLRKEFFYV